MLARCTAAAPFLCNPLDVSRQNAACCLGQVADDLWALQYDAQILTVDRHSMEVAHEALTDSASLLTALGGGWWNDNI